MAKTRLKFSLSLVAVIALMGLVVGVVAGRASGGSSGGGSGGGSGGAAAGKRVDVIIKASDSEFWQSMLAGAKKAGDDYGLEVGLFGPTSETDVNQQVQLVENSISRGVDAIVVAPNSSDALNNVIDRARDGGTKVIVADTAVTTESEGFIGTDNVKAAEQAGARLCDLAKEAGNDSGDVMIASSVAGVQVLKDREAGFRSGLKACPNLKVSIVRYNNNDLNTAASQVNDALTANPNLVGIFAANNTSGNGAARAIKDNDAADRIPVVAFDTDPQENAALADGSIDALVVQNPYFFGYQGVIEAAMATVDNVPPRNLDPGAVLADRDNMKHARGRAAADPADRQGAVMAATVTAGKPVAERELVVSLEGVSKRYGPIQALEDVSLELRAGEVHCLAGENGAGKSTLIKILTGAVQRDGGDYAIEGREMGDPSPAEARDAGIGVVYQELSLLPDLSVGENLLMGRLPARRGITRPGELRKQARAMLERVGLEWLDPGTPVEETSLAVRQLVEIAKVLGPEPARADLRRADHGAVGERDQGAARAHPPAARRGPRGHVRVASPRGDVRDRRPGHDPARREVRQDGADERARPRRPDRLDGRPQDREPLPARQP